MHAMQDIGEIMLHCKNFSVNNGVVQSVSVTQGWYSGHHIILIVSLL